MLHTCSLSHARTRTHTHTHSGEAPAFEENIVAKGADLRKLKMPELAAIMKNFGMHQSEIDKLPR